MDLHLHQQQAHIINGDLIVRICSAGILPEEIPSGKPVPLPRLQSPAAPLHPWMKCYWSLLLLLRHAKCSDSRSEADHSPAVLRDVTQSSADRQTERQTETCTHTDTHTHCKSTPSHLFLLSFKYFSGMPASTLLWGQLLKIQQQLLFAAYVQLPK